MMSMFLCPYLCRILLLTNFSRGVTYCSPTKQWYWFNPVEILVSELLAGAQIALPAEAVTVLNLLKIGSRIMYGCFMAGIVVNFVLIPLSLLVIRTRWWSLLLSILSAISAILVTLAAAIATTISVAAKVALTAQDQLNIRANIGIKMFVFMWIAAIFTDLAFLLHAAMGCCCKPDRQRQTPQQQPMYENKGNRMSLPGFVRHRKSHGSSS